MALYERLLMRTDAGERPDVPRIPVHGFVAIMGERARAHAAGIDTNAKAQEAIEAISGTPLTVSEGQEALELLGTISGSATARLARAREITDVLEAAVLGVPQFDTPAKVKARLGV